MVDDPFADLRSQLLDQARDALEAIVARYRPKIEQAHSERERAELYRCLHAETGAMSKQYARTLATIPPPPVVIPVHVARQLKDQAQ